MKRYLPFIIIAVVLVIAVAGGTWLLRSSQSTSGPAAGNNSQSLNGLSGVSGNKNASSPAPSGAPAPGAEPPHVKGQETAQVTLEEFGDFQCPPCGLLEPQLKRIEADYGARVRFIFRNFPLPKIHQNAVDAARAAEAAGLQNRFWEMHDMLYEKQGEWGVMPSARPIFEGYAHDLGLDVDRFKRDMDGMAANSRITSDVQRADSLGVRGTPTLYVNGHEMPATDMNPAGIRSAIDAALRGKG